jgi:type II secretory ATPase GspE/PulE/Tfp pilus assembly ATPase PilB-like protein
MRVGMDDLELRTMERALHDAVVKRLRVMVGVDREGEGEVALRSGGQKQRFTVRLQGAERGTRVRLRVRGRGGFALPLDDLGMEPAVRERVERALRRRRGLVLVSAPGGEGVQTTLYAAAHYADRHAGEPGTVASMEPRVRVPLPFLYQVEVGSSVPGALLQSLLEQPYRALFVRMLPDNVTAQVAFEAARARLVVASLGAADPYQALGRAVKLVGAQLVNEVFVLGVGQRLLPRLCLACRRPHELSADEVRRLGELAMGEQLQPLFRADGCDRCRGRGVVGRRAIFWLVESAPWLSAAVAAGAAPPQLEHEARSRQVSGAVEVVARLAHSGEVGVEALLQLLEEASEHG